MKPLLSEPAKLKPHNQTAGQNQSNLLRNWKALQNTPGSNPHLGARQMKQHLFKKSTYFSVSSTKVPN